MDGGATETIGEGSVPDLGGLERWWNDPGIAAWSFILFGCFLLNATLLLAFLIRPGLRTISNRFVMNLTVSNLLTCVVLNPLLIMDSPLRSGAEGRFTSSSGAGIGGGGGAAGGGGGSICAISEGATALVTTSSVLSVLLIAVDQYLAVVDPLRYRTRVDKLKSGILIMTVWLISAIFGFVAFFNPNPHSLWLSCITIDCVSVDNISVNSSATTITESAIGFFENVTSALDVNEIPEIMRTFESIKIDTTIEFTENSTIVNESITYGLIYAIVYSIFAYFLPFAAVCWIYVSIYIAAHRNSERTRRTGSRPILSSAPSFCEDQNALTRQQNQLEPIDDFRRIPKISSLSSIDETSETTQPANQISRIRSFSSALEIGLASDAMDDDISSGVVFTVGSQRVEVSPQRAYSADDEKANRIPVSTLKAEFLEKNRDPTTYGDLVRSKFLDKPDHRRKSSHDIMYEEMVARETVPETWISGCSSEDNSDLEDEPRFHCFDTLEVPQATHGSIVPQQSRKYFSPFCDYQPTLIDEVDQQSDNISTSCTPKESLKSFDSNGRRNDHCLNIQGKNHLHPNLDPEERHGKSSILRNPIEGRTSRRSSTTFAIADIVLNPSECSNSICRNERNNSVSNNASEPSSCLLAPIVTITPAPGKNGTLHRVASIRSTSSYINSLKYRISNGSLFRYREETRAARISALVIVMGLICWSPHVILLVMKNLPQYSDQYLPHEYDVLALTFLILAAYVTPLLFGYRSRRVKRELRKFFCFKRELSYKNNRSLMAKKVLKRRHSSTLSHLEMDHKYNIFNCVYGRSRWPKEKVQFVQVPDTALAVETCRSSFSSGASTQISSTSTEEC